jgi:hypothetical protein
MVLFNYGKSLEIPEGVSMPITAFLVGYETGFSFPDREIFTFEGWRMIHNGRWGLRRWSDNNPALTTYGFFPGQIIGGLDGIEIWL